MGKMKELAQEVEEAEQLAEEEQQAQQEAYYWHCLQEFVAICKVFGMEKVGADLKLVREQLEGVKEEPRIIVPK